MCKPNVNQRKSIRQKLLSYLREENVFWSYDCKSMDIDSINDDQLIALTMRYLDLTEIKMLFDIFPKNKIKTAWRRLLVPEGAYLYTLNRFFAWYYFNAKRPDSYLKSLETRRMNQIAV